jgi:hypothetical protein
MYAGGLPYEAYLVDLISRGEYQVLNQNLDQFTIYFYCVFFMVLAVSGYTFQMKHKSMTDLVKVNEVKTILPNNINSTFNDELIDNTQ